MDAHDEAADPRHVVDVGEADEADGGQVMDEHDEEVLGRQRGQRLKHPATVLSRLSGTSDLEMT